MQLRDEFRAGPAELEPEEIGEQLVVAKPCPIGVDRHHECVRRFELEKESLGPVRSEQAIRQRAIDSVEDRGPQEQGLNGRRLALQDLGEQVVGDGPLAARERGDESFRVRAPGKRQGGQPQAGGPAFRPGPASRSRLFSDRLTPAPARSWRVSSSVNRRSAARSSVSCPARRRRWRPKGGSWRVASTIRNAGGRSAMSVSSWASACAEVSSWRSSTTRTTEAWSAARLAIKRRTNASPSNSGVGAGLSTPPSGPTAIRSWPATCSQNRCGSRSSRPTDTHAVRCARPASLDPRAEEQRLATAGRRGNQGHRSGRPGQPFVERRPSNDGRSPGWHRVDAPHDLIVAPRNAPNGPNSADSVEAGSSAARGSCCLDHVHGASPGGSVGRAQRAHEE